MHTLNVNRLSRTAVDTMSVSLIFGKEMNILRNRCSYKPMRNIGTVCNKIFKFARKKHELDATHKTRIAP